MTRYPPGRMSGRLALGLAFLGWLIMIGLIVAGVGDTLGWWYL